MRLLGECLAFNQHLLCVSTTPKGKAEKELTVQNMNIPETQRKPGNHAVPEVCSFPVFSTIVFSCVLKTKMEAKMEAKSATVGFEEDEISRQ